MKKIIILLLVIFFFASCKKDSNSTQPTKLVEKAIIASVGGTLTTLDSIHLVIPPYALSADANVSVGRKGIEPTSLPNTNLQIVGKPITMRISASSILKPIQLSFPVPLQALNSDTCSMFLYNGSTYFPVEYTINGKTVSVIIDTISWESSDKKAKLSGSDIYIVWVIAKHIIPLSEIGLKEVTIQSGKMTYNEPLTVNTSSRVLLLIHGIASGPDTWSNLIPAFQQSTNVSYTNYWTFGYNASLSISRNAENLANLLSSKVNGSQIDIIGFGMGGLVARSTIEQYGGSSYIRRLITLGTPHQGANPLAIRYLLGNIVARVNPLYSLIFNYFTKGLRDLNANSTFIKQMMTLTKPPIPYYTIASTNDESLWLIGSRIISGLDDGLVSVESAKGLQGAESPDVVINIPVAIAHTEMSNSPLIISQIINYLWKSDMSPTISTNTPTLITASSALFGGNITFQGGSPVIARGVCWSTSQKPTISNSKTTDGEGIGTFTSRLSGLNANVTYYVRAYATNSTGTGYGDEIWFMTLISGGSNTVTDIDGNIYHTVVIGTQEWMVENLKTTKFNDGISIPHTFTSTWQSTTPGYDWLSYNASNKDIYGALYNWYAVNSGKLCPIGWHVSTDSEWSKMIDFLGGKNVAGSKLREKDPAHWNSNTVATNESGFTALPGGSFQLGFWGVSAAYFWTPTELSSLGALSWIIGNNSKGILVDSGESYKSAGLSIRCVRD